MTPLIGRRRFLSIAACAIAFSSGARSNGLLVWCGAGGGGGAKLETLI